jgi:hypothetical protein
VIEATPSRTRRIALACGFVLLATVLQLLRQRGHAPWDTIQSDDGTGFIVPAWRHNPVSLLWTQYAGYLQLAPRIVATPLAVLPHSWAAAYAAVVPAIVTALLGLFVVRASDGLVRQEPLRWLLGVIVVLGPAVAFETTATIAQLQFPLVFAAFWAIISLDTSRRLLVVRIAVVVMAALSSVLALTLLPIAAVVTLARRQRADVVLASAFGISAVGQIVALLVVPTPPPLVARTLDGIEAIYGQRVLGAGLVGEAWAQSAWNHLGPILSGLALLAVVILSVIFGATTVRAQWWYAGAAFLWSFGILVVSLYARGLVPFLVPRDHVFLQDGVRYMLIPGWLVVSGLVLLAGGPPHPVPRWLERCATVARVVLVAQTVLIVAVGFRVTTIRSPGPSWSSELRRVERGCQKDPRGFAYPLFSPPNFYGEIPCDEL